MTSTNPHQLFNFPCQFPIKCIGKQAEFKSVVCDIITKHIGQIQAGQIKTKSSKKSKYLSVTITILATSKEQLDTIYTELNNHPSVLYSL